ncbi:TetR/AcrR family transcriptional regulator [Ostreiculturibacter nitratireducens]|uniref:TetR/AcrR family transcriptional regulator n=1 Tax=Ostreiculturibacter nitratireducens TaxID=3075226 RepID=UPI0031B647A1
MTDKVKPVAPAAEHSADSLSGNVKATREDWLNVARDLLVSDGVSEVKVLTIGTRLGVSRSSFYWYFKSRKDLLEQLLADWEATNTGILLKHCTMPADTITAAVCNLFRCFIAPDGFNYQLDFAVREWARRDGSVRRVIDRSDAARTRAITAMFERFGYDPYEAEVRARVLYYQQIGYYALDLAEPLEERLERVEGYLHAFTGVKPRPEEVAAFYAYARQQSGT